MIVVALVFISAQFNVNHFLSNSVASLSVQSVHGNSFMAAAGLSFNQTLLWVRGVGYVVMFLAMVVEGPVITAAAAFAARLGYFNIWAVLILAILGDLTADFGYYLVGYLSRISLIEKYGRNFGLSSERMKRVEKLLKTNPIKTLAVIKLVPGLSTPGLMAVGASRMSIRKYVTTATSIILPKVILFAALGYYFGQVYDSIAHYVQGGEYLIIAAILVTLLVYWGYNKLSRLIARRIEPI
jgi:membrane protein DedA with SNARE-associated domain